MSHFSGLSAAIQTWSQQPRYQEVNPEGTVILPCIIQNKKGECRWERDGSPVGIYPQKYEWSSTPETGDCSLKISDASLEYDDGVWQCQVTPSSFSAKDALVSEGAELVVRGESIRAILRPCSFPESGASVKFSIKNEIFMINVQWNGSSSIDLYKSDKVNGLVINLCNRSCDCRAQKTLKSWDVSFREKSPTTTRDSFFTKFTFQSLFFSPTFL